MNSTDPHIEKFVGHGGKLLMYHGWADYVSPYNTVEQPLKPACVPQPTTDAARERPAHR